MALIWSEAFSDFFLFGISNIIKNWKKDAKILDVGCGNGALLKKLKKLGFKNLYGIDASRRNIDKAKNKEKEIKFFCGDITKKLPFRNEFFDIVIAVAILEHILDDDLSKFLNEINRVLKKNGLFIIEVPYRQRLNYVVCPNCLAVFEKDEHLRSFDESGLEAILNNYGFRKKIIKLFIPFTPRKEFKSIALLIGFSKLLQKIINPTEMIFIAEKSI
ncbi:MAG: class I SAM-dependent methyltransferase [Candidatus Aenigmatarchaeota archaeon]